MDVTAGVTAWTGPLQLGLKTTHPLRTDSVHLSMDNSGKLKLTRINVLLLSNPIRQTLNVDQYHTPLLSLFFLDVTNVK